MRYIKEQWSRITDHLEENPSLAAKIDQQLPHAYSLAVIAAVDETGLAESRFPSAGPYSCVEVTDAHFWPHIG